MPLRIATTEGAGAQAPALRTFRLSEIRSLPETDRKAIMQQRHELKARLVAMIHANGLFASGRTIRATDVASLEMNAAEIMIEAGLGKFDAT